MKKILICLFGVLALHISPAYAEGSFTAPLSEQSSAQCGGDFAHWLKGVKREAQAKGYEPALIDRFFRDATPNPRVLEIDGAQRVFRFHFIEFSDRIINPNRYQDGKERMEQYADILHEGEAIYGVPAALIVALWGLESDYGRFQGNYPTLSSLLTLAHDCRRPDFFRPQIFHALTLFARGEFSPATAKGAWAGEIGMIQLLPKGLLEHGVDADGDGKINTAQSVADAVFSGMKMLSDFGWEPNAPWLQEVSVPDNMDWHLADSDIFLPVAHWQNLGIRGRGQKLRQNTEAALLLPQGHRGPAFLAYPNFFVLLEWNQSLNYVLSAAYFATLLDDMPPYLRRQPEPGLSPEEVVLLQQALQSQGHDVGNSDGIIGRKTRSAVKKEQQNLGYPADSWPTKSFLEHYLNVAK